MSQHVIKWLRQAAEEIRTEGHAGWGNTIDDAIAALEAAEAREAELRARVAELEGMAAERNNLLYQVAEVTPGQSRYETALSRLASYNNRPANPPQSALPAALKEEV